MENVNNEVIQTAEEMAENYELAQTSDGSFGKTFIGICLAGIGVGIAAKIIYKNKDKICNWMVGKLAKAGYKYTEEVDDHECDDWFDRFDDDDDEVVIENEETGE